MIDRLAPEMIRLALKAFPRRFRDAYAQDMSDFFDDRWRASSGFWNRGALFIRSVASVLIAGALEHARPSDTLPRPVEIRGPKGGIVNSVLQDVRFALRLMRRQPSYALFVVLTLAIGIGANTAVFSVVNGVLLKPLPFAESDRLVAIWGRFDPESGFDFPRFVLSIPEYLDYRNQSRSYRGSCGLGTGVTYGRWGGCRTRTRDWSGGHRESLSPASGFAGVRSNFHC